MLLALPGLYLASRGNSALISVACGVLTRLFCDPVLREPRTLLWPLYGWTFHNTYGKGNGLPVNLTLDVVFGSLGLLLIWRQWRAARGCGTASVWRDMVNECLTVIAPWAGPVRVDVTWDPPVIEHRLSGTFGWDCRSDMDLAVGDGGHGWSVSRSGLREAKEALRARLYGPGQR